MSHNHTGSDAVAFPVAIAEPDDGDAADAASVNVPFEAHDDAIASLVSRIITWAQSGAAPTTAYGQKVSMAAPLEITENRWSPVPTTAGGVSGLGWVNDDVGSIGTIWFEIIPPHAMARLSHVRVRCKGGGGGGNMPGSPPTVETAVIDDNVVTGSGSPTTDPSDRATYDNWHTIEHPAIDNEPLTTGKRLAVIVSGESGADKTTGFTVADITCTWTNEAAP